MAVKVKSLSSFLNSSLQAFFGDCSVKEAFANNFFIVVPTYAEMLVMAGGCAARIILVLNDENKDQTNTLYIYFPNQVVLWIAAVEEINLQ